MLCVKLFLTLGSYTATAGWVSSTLSGARLESGKVQEAPNFSCGALEEGVALGRVGHLELFYEGLQALVPPFLKVSLRLGRVSAIFRLQI